MWNQNIKFFKESMTLYIYDGRLLILVFLTFLQSLAQLHDDPIMAHLWVDVKLITVNEITRNLFVKQTKSDS